MVPRSIALVVTDVSKCPCPDVVDPAFFLKSPRLLKLAITLLYERSLGAESKVRLAAPASSDLQSHLAPLAHGTQRRKPPPRLQVQTYIAALPEVVDLPCLWDGESLERLRNQGLRDRITAQAEQWRGWHGQLHAASPQCPWSEADLQWALACVASRAFTGPYIGSTIQVRPCHRPHLPHPHRCSRPSPRTKAA